MSDPADIRSRSETAGGQAPAAYRVLARTHRPQRLSELIGQETLVRTLTNALATGRVAHAFLLTGIRGVGKTTTARIIARALNCIGADGQGGPTPEPCGVCEPCVAIADSRHIDVLEMDAATRTGIDDIREIVESVRYAPTSARSKVYIIDEVHMLSEKAFNGLLKTLEEPPPRTVFIFATTEVRKVPVTVLSRCQRFDLRRVESDVLEHHLGRIAAGEAAALEPSALSMIVRAAEGSVRDGLSLLDQAIALAGQDAPIGAELVRDMLGLADRAQLLELFELLMKGDIKAVLDRLAAMYDRGVEPEAVVHDLLEITHWLTRIKVTPAVADSFGLTDADVARARDLAAGLGVAVLARCWQMLLKGLDDLRIAPDPLLAAEMLLVRIAYVADLPPPGQMATGPETSGEPAGRTLPPAPASPAPAPADRTGQAAAPADQPDTTDVVAVAPEPPEPPAPPAPPDEPSTVPVPTSFAAAVGLFEQLGEATLHGWLYQAARMVHFEPGRIELFLPPGTASDLPGRVAQALGRWTGRPWLVSLARESEGAEPSLAEQAAAEKRARLEAIAEDPRVRSVLERFPGARIVDVRAASSAAPSSESQQSNQAESR